MNIYHHCEESAEGRKIYCSAKSCWLGRFLLEIEIRCFSHDVYSHLRIRSDYVAQNRVKGGQTMTEKSDGILFTGSISINKDIRCFFSASWLMAERHRIHATSMQTPDESLQCPVVYLKPGLICRLNRIGNKKNAKAIACWVIRKKSLDGKERKSPSADIRRTRLSPHTQHTSRFTDVSARRRRRKGIIHDDDIIRKNTMFICPSSIFACLSWAANLFCNVIFLFPSLFGCL